MKKFLIICLCLLTVLSMSCCGKENKKTNSTTSSNKHRDESVVRSETQSTPSSSEESYKDIVCTKILGFQEVRFYAKNSNTIIFIKIPKDWKLQKSANGYSVLKNSQTIGSVTTSTAANNTNQSVNVFNQEISTNGLKVINNIDRIDSGKRPSYTRTFSYNYDEAGKTKSIVLTFNYEEVDSSSIYEMMATAKKQALHQKNMGVLTIKDNRNKILILGNSFVNSSNIGNILQTMCGSAISVEAQSRGMATVSTYTKDNYTLQNIRSGKYSALFMCGLFSDTDFLEMEKIIEACKNSNTKLAIFPAHNESRTIIDKAYTMYSDTIILDWKSEIDTLITDGINMSNFCIADSYKHSTPLAGYVGAHMIYRAIFNKIPQNTNIPGVSQLEINLLGEYPTTGTINLLDNFKALTIE